LKSFKTLSMEKVLLSILIMGIYNPLLLG